MLDVAQGQPERQASPPAPTASARPSPYRSHVPIAEMPREGALLAEEVLAAFAYNTPLIV